MTITYEHILDEVLVKVNVYHQTNQRVDQLAHHCKLHTELYRKQH